MSRLTEDSKPQLEQTRDELREAIESSRELVRRSRTLLELSECDRPVPAHDNDGYSPDVLRRVTRERRI